jgi:hypothetical protein
VSISQKKNLSGSAYPNGKIPIGRLNQNFLRNRQGKKIVTCLLLYFLTSLSRVEWRRIFRQKYLRQIYAGAISYFRRSRTLSSEGLKKPDVRMNATKLWAKGVVVHEKKGFYSLRDVSGFMLCDYAKWQRRRFGRRWNGR